MQHYGLIGKQLGHSFSKRYFSAKFEREQIDASYSLIELDDISTIVDVVRNDSSLNGLNVTIPYKESVISYLDDISAEAMAIGAVNCIAINKGKMTGYNTDVEGIRATLKELNIDTTTEALILGSGGACKAVSYVLHQLNIPHLTVARGESSGDITYTKLSKDIIASHKLIINTTPLGMHPNIDSAPEIDYTAIGTQHKVFDLVYNPSPTLFMHRAEERGAQCIGGMLMLKVQAEASWQIWQSRR